MDGDRRPRFRPIIGDDGAEHGLDEAWGYSARILADFGRSQTVESHAGAQDDIARTRFDDEPRSPRPPASLKPDRKVGKQAPQDDADDDTKDGAEGKPDEKQDKVPTPRWKRILYWVVGLAVLAALIIAGVLYYLSARHYENTDDAFIDGHMSQVSAQVAAKVLHLAIEDNQQVKAGAPILQLDPRDYQVKLDQALAQQAQAQAQLQQSQAGLLQQQANVDQAEANVRVSQADLGQQQVDLARYRAIDPKAISRQQLDTSSAQTKSAAARVDASQQAVASGRAMVESQKAQIAASVANLKAADAAVENAQLQLGYTTVTAPDDGRVTRRTVEVGNYVNPGQSLLAIVPANVWVTANFKETQLADMKAGQPVRIRVDACPGADFPGHVDSFQFGTGAVFSSLPAENATGNYVKVVQRVPVKVVFDKLPPEDECHLSLGLSVSPRVTVR